MRKLLTISLLACFCFGCSSAQKRTQAQMEFEQAAILPSTLINDAPIQTREWWADVVLPDTRTVVIHAQSGTGFVYCYYTDKSVTEVYRYTDYMSVTDLRVSADNRLLYIRLEGLSPRLGEDWRQTWIYVYDMQKRTRPAKYKFDESP